MDAWFEEDEEVFVQVVPVIGGWLLVISAMIAWYTATAMVAENMTGRQVLPLGAHKGSQKAPPVHPIAYPAGMPGVKIGQ